MSGMLREPRLLPHGELTVLYEPAPGPLTAIAVAVRAGARFDGPHPGIAHIAEHMLFQGTRSHDQTGINRLAGDLGGEHDADTGY
jgi:predicted Zn-dependent peptidase